MDSDHHNEKSLVQVLTLEDTINSFGDEGKTIHYLKVDVEGHELKAMHDWLDSGVLEVSGSSGVKGETNIRRSYQMNFLPNLDESIHNW